jgi:hypothetical protein
MTYNITKVNEYTFLNKDDVLLLDGDYILASDEQCIKIYDLSYKEIWEIKISKRIREKTYANNILILFNGDEWIKYNILKKTEEILPIISDMIYIMKDLPYIITFNNNIYLSIYIVNILNYNTNELIDTVKVDNCILSIKNRGDIIIFNHPPYCFTVYNLKSKKLEGITGKVLDIFNETVYFLKILEPLNDGVLYIFQNDEIISKNIDIIDCYYDAIVLDESWLIMVNAINMILLNINNTDKHILLKDCNKWYRDITFSSDKSKVFYMHHQEIFKSDKFDFKGYKVIMSNIEFIDIK